MQNASYSPAAERNRQPILQVLSALLPPTGRALEVASGTGQHVAWFAAALPGWTWQPSDAQDAQFEAIAAWCTEAGVRNVLPPVLLDVLEQGLWPEGARLFWAGSERGGAPQLWERLQALGVPSASLRSGRGTRMPWSRRASITM